MINYDKRSAERKAAISWWLKTKPPDQSFMIDSPHLDKPKRVQNYKQFWKDIGEVFQAPVRVDIWEDGTLTQLHLMVKASQKDFYTPIRGQEGKLPFEMREKTETETDLDF